MRILVINYEYPPIGGGAGEVSQHLAREYAHLGHDVLVVTSRWGDLPRNEVADGVQVLRHGALRRHRERSSIPGMAAYLALALPAVWRAATRFRPDAVHVHFAVPCGPLAWLLDRLRGIPYVVTLHGGDVPTFTASVSRGATLVHGLIRPLVRPLLRRARAVLAVGEGLRAMASSDFPYLTNLHTVWNGVDTERFRPADGRADPPILVCACRFAAQKNLPVLFHALRRLRDTSPELEFRTVIYGDGPERAALETLLAELDLTERVSLPGWVDREELAGRLREASVFVLPSRVEGLPMAALQGMASGLPIVGSDVAGINEVVADGESGVLVPAGDAEALADALARVLLDRPLRDRMGAAGRARAEEHFSWPVLARQCLGHLARTAPAC